jgi:hypothetical protein
VAAELESRLDLRWIEHGFAHYLTHVASGGTVDWRDTVKFHVMNTTTFFDHTRHVPRDHRPGQVGAGGRSDLESQIAVAQEISELPGLTRDERLRFW